MAAAHEQAQSQMLALKNQVSLATITVVVAEKGIEASSLIKESEAIDLGVWRRTSSKRTAMRAG